MPETIATRLLRLLPLLTSRPAWRGQELAEALGVTSRTVRRDIERLRDLGYLVAATPGSHGGYSLRAGNGLPPLLLDDDSAVAVAIGLRTVATRGMEEAAARAAAAIHQVLPARLRHRVEALTATTVPLPVASPSFLITTWRSSPRHASRASGCVSSTATGRVLRLAAATRDIDVTPEASKENLARLSLALTELGARIRTEAVPDGLPFSHDATSLAAAEEWNLICRDGEFDISFHPSGFAGGYAQLVVNAHRLRVGEVEVVVADLADVIRSKESAGRPKDLRVLPLLYRQQSARRAGGMDDGLGRITDTQAEGDQAADNHRYRRPRAREGRTSPACR